MRSTTNRAHFRPRRSKGQSFLRDRTVIDRIVAAVALRPEDTLLEIGAGAGELTLPLAAAGPRRILAVEADPRLAAELESRLASRPSAPVEILAADFLRLDLPHLLDERGIERVRVVANLPYAVASPILLRLLAARDRLEDLTLMFQKEVAQRLVATPGTKAYGFLTVVTQQAATVRPLLTVPPQAFWPQPKVVSQVVRLELRREAEPDVVDYALFQELVKALLAHRRKNITNNIKRLASARLTAPGVRAGLAALAIDPTRRGETLSVEEFAALAHFCASRR